MFRHLLHVLLEYLHFLIQRLVCKHRQLRLLLLLNIRHLYHIRLQWNRLSLQHNCQPFIEIVLHFFPIFLQRELDPLNFLLQFLKFVEAFLINLFVFFDFVLQPVLVRMLTLVVWV